MVSWTILIDQIIFILNYNSFPWVPSVQPIGHHFGHLPWKGGFLPIEFFWTSFCFFPQINVCWKFFNFLFIFFPNKSLWIILSIFLNFLFYFLFFPNKRVLEVFQLPFYFIFPNKSVWIILSWFLVLSLSYLGYFYFVVIFISKLYLLPC